MNWLEGKVLLKECPLPLYYQLKEILLKIIAHSNSGEPIPTEKELCDHFSISGATAKRAINELVASGYLYRLKGKGTFISTPKINQDHISFVDSFYRSMTKKGHVVSTKILELKIVKSDERIVKALSLPHECEVVKLRRLRYVDNEPNNVTLNYLPYSKFPDICSRDLEHESLYKIFEENYGYKVHRHEGFIESRVAGDYEATLLNVKIGTPLQYIENTSYLADGTPIEFYMVSYRGDLNRFRYQITKKVNET